MNKVIAILMSVLLLGYTYAAAEVLSDSQLSSIYAGQDFDVEVNDEITSDNSVVVHQRNVGIAGSTGGNVSDTKITNSNMGTATNTGDSSVALQTNIAAIAALGTTASSGNTLSNTNDATVDNVVLGQGTTVDGTLDGTAVSGDIIEGADVFAEQSAVAHQDNIAAVAGNGSISETSIANSNKANVMNVGDSAVAMQNNIGVVAGGPGDNVGNMISNTNEATVDNTIITGAAGTVQGGSNDEVVSSGSSLLTSITSSKSAVASQINIGGVMAEGNVLGASISNSNTATAINGP